MRKSFDAPEWKSKTVFNAPDFSTIATTIVIAYTDINYSERRYTLLRLFAWIWIQYRYGGTRRFPWTRCEQPICSRPANLRNNRWRRWTNNISNKKRSFAIFRSDDFWIIQRDNCPPFREHSFSFPSVSEGTRYRYQRSEIKVVGCRTGNRWKTVDTGNDFRK